jgi:hypothetical protein
LPFSLEIDFSRQQINRLENYNKIDPNTKFRIGPRPLKSTGTSGFPEFTGSHCSADGAYKRVTLEIGEFQDRL